MPTAATKTAAKPAAKKLMGAENVGYAVTDDSVMIIVSRKAAGRPSASGKNIVFASTKGNRQIPGTELTLGLNVYGPAEG